MLLRCVSPLDCYNVLLVLGPIYTFRPTKSNFVNISKGKKNLPLETTWLGRIDVEEHDGDEKNFRKFQESTQKARVG